MFSVLKSLFNASNVYLKAYFENSIIENSF